MHPDEADPIDRYVGNRIRGLRKQRGLSQQGLADAIGLTFQQIQKYERGTNRVSASVLYRIAESLGVEFGYFTEGYKERVVTGAPNFAEMLTDTHGIEVAKNFMRLTPEIRRQIANLVVTVAAPT